MKKDFNTIYGSLNEKQKEAVDTLYGPVLVIAWPGSGKTQILSARIANILLETDYLPSNILCLTFTDNAARNMRERLAGMIGPDAYKIAIHTFHSFWNEVLGRYKYLFREYDDANVIDDITASQFLDAILAPLPWNHPYKPRWNASDSISSIRSTIDNLKKWGITPKIFREILEINRASLEQLWTVMTEIFTEIDALSQKKDDKLKKIELFDKFTKIIQELPENNKKPGNIESILESIKRSLRDIWTEYEGNGNAKFITKWRDTWTEKDYRWIRVWKEIGKLEKQLALADIYESYTKALEENGYIDYMDMIIRATEMIETDTMIQVNLAEQYQFILIDEYQDTNEAQMRMIRSILSVWLENPNIFAVGDDDQSIYKFQGANMKNIRDFHDAFPETKLIILDTNYRSHSEIIETSRKSLLLNTDRIATIFPGNTKHFHAHRGAGGITEKHLFANELEEITWIVEDIKKRIENGTKPEEIAIITKKNKTLELFAKLLLNERIPVNISKSESIFESDMIILIVNILKYLHSLNTRQEAGNILVDIIAHPAWNLPRLELWKISRDIYHARKAENKSWIEQISSSTVPEIRDVGFFLKELSNLSEYARLEDLVDLITGANSLELEDSEEIEVDRSQLQIDTLWGGRKNYISPIYSYFFDEISFDNWSNTKKARYLANMKKLVDKIRSYKNTKPLLMLDDAIDILELVETYSIRIETSELIGNPDHAVNLTTVYKAKWLEWDTVYVPFLHHREYKLSKPTGSVLPKNLPLEAEKDDDEDIERLVYTAFTRAENALILSISRTNIEEKTNEPLPNISLEDGDWQETETLQDKQITTLEEEKKNLYTLPYLWEEKDFLRDRIDKMFVMNVTALQNFLDISGAGPEYFIGNNLLRFPQGKHIAASYGSTIHEALEKFFIDYSTRKTFSKQLLHDTFEKSFKKEWFPEHEEKVWIDRGHENIEALYAEITGKTYGELVMEKDFRTEWGGIFLDDIQLTGKIDRIEKLADDTLIVTDYKTGKGFDAFDGQWDKYKKIKQWKYRLQLAFYAILFDLSPYYRLFPKRRYELFFVEQNQEEKRFQRIEEYIQQGEIERTKDLIRAVMRKIQNLDFPDISHYPKDINGIRQFEEDLLNGNI